MVQQRWLSGAETTVAFDSPQAPAVGQTLNATVVERSRNHRCLSGAETTSCFRLNKNEKMKKTGKPIF
jgi:hypothetical protein